MTRPSQMNNLDLIKNKTTRSTLSYGIYPLHLLMNAMECILHLSYKLSTKKWSARRTKVKDIIKKRKENMKNNIKKILGILVNTPLHEYGSSNRGNMMQECFFEYYEITTKIIKINQNLI